MGEAIHYRVEIDNAHAHLFRVRLEIPSALENQELSLPVWIPGSYLVREFSQHLSSLCSETHEIEQVRKNAWRVHNAKGERVAVEYLVYAFDPSVRMAYLDAQRGFVNGTSLFLRAVNLENTPHRLRFVPYQNWRYACALSEESMGEFIASCYDELVDSPVEMGNFASDLFWEGTFTAHGIPHRLVLTHPGVGWDAARLLQDCQRICEAAIAFWHPDYVAHLNAGGLTHEVAPHLRPPHQNYLFLLNCVADGYGGLEHRNSTALIAPRSDLPRLGHTQRSEGYTSLLGLISHEYFHTWCVKRLRPIEFKKYDYEQENYTRLLWFFEGFTSYYDDLLLRRAGLVDENTYLKLLAKNLNHSLQMPGSLVQSVAEASFDAWVKYYRIGENTPNITVSYYTKGCMVALCFDLQLRQGGRSLEELMRLLWQRCWLDKTGEAQGTMSEQDFLDALQALTGRSWQAEMRHWVESTEALPLEPLLKAQGYSVVRKEAVLTQTLGLRVSELGYAVQIKNVFRGSAAEKAGLAAGDEIWGVVVDMDVKLDTSNHSVHSQKGLSWRIKSLTELEPYLQLPQKVSLTVARDGRILQLPWTAPPEKALVWSIEKAKAV